MRAIKRKPLRGYVHVPLPGGERGYLDQTTAVAAPEWFGRIVSAGVTWNRVGPLVLIPIPDAACGAETGLLPKTVALAQALKAALPEAQACVLDVLRWDEPMASGHLTRGTRDPQELYSRLRLTCRRLPPQPPRMVLIDDVLASGGHLRAAAAFLTDCGGLVFASCCAGRAIHTDDVPTNAFSIRTDVLADFCADPDWLLPTTVSNERLLSGRLRRPLPGERQQDR
jgi:hypothetical protein